jgi:DNA-damage-inducible protein D
MKNELLNNNKTVFEQIKQVDEQGNEWWSARHLGKILEYSEYRHFKPVIEKAKEACVNSQQLIEDHFEDFLEMVDIGSAAKRPMGDGIKLSRYASYLIVQNADSSKEVVAQGQTYFAVQTRLQVQAVSSTNCKEKSTENQSIHKILFAHLFAKNSN